ncbi:MAG: lipase family protein [Acidobacteriota bacterium]
MQKSAPVYSADYVFHPEQDLAYRHFEDAAAHPFEPTPAAVSRVNAWWLAEAALLSYSNPDRAIPVFEAAGLESEFLRANTTDCYVAWNAAAVIVAFRGTEPDEWPDVLTDAKIHLDPWQAGRVHHGFQEALRDIWPALTIRLSTLSATRAVWFCGHSLGAALANLAGDLYPSTRGVCSFGSPLLGDQAFVDAFNTRLSGRCLRYVNHLDAVTHVPPSLFGYRHVDAVRNIAKNGKITGNTAPFLHYFSDLFGHSETLLPIIQTIQSKPTGATPTFMLDHMPKAYAIWTWNDYDAHG